MRRHNISFWGLMFSGLLLILTWQAVGFVQDNEPDRSGMNYIFTDMKRTPPEFDHDIHEAAFDDGGCAKCHHVLDENTKKIVSSFSCRTTSISGSQAPLSSGLNSCTSRGGFS